MRLRTLVTERVLYLQHSAESHLKRILRETAQGQVPHAEHTLPRLMRKPAGTREQNTPLVSTQCPLLAHLNVVLAGGKNIESDFSSTKQSMKVVNAETVN